VALVLNAPMAQYIEESWRIGMDSTLI
jgi:hypothetical protein